MSSILYIDRIFNQFSLGPNRAGEGQRYHMQDEMLAREFMAPFDPEFSIKFVPNGFFELGAFLDDSYDALITNLPTLGKGFSIGSYTPAVSKLVRVREAYGNLPIIVRTGASLRGEVGDFIRESLEPCDISLFEKINPKEDAEEIKGLLLKILNLQEEN